MGSDNGWTFKQAILVYTPSPFLLLPTPPSVTCPVTNPIIMPIQLSKLCAYFNFSSLFTVAFFSPPFLFFGFFVSRFMAWKTLEWWVAKGGGGGASALIGAATFSVAFKCDGLICVFFAVIPRQTI